MKNLLTLLLFVTSLSAVAQHRVLRQSVDDNGRRLVVEIDVEQRGEPVHFKGTFDVTRMGRRDKERLLNHIRDSLALPRDAHRVALLDQECPEQSEELNAPGEAAPRVRQAPVAVKPFKNTREFSPTTPQMGVGAFASAGNTPAVTRVTSSAAESLVAETFPVPYSRSIDDNPSTGKLRMRYVYEREGDERVYERTVDVRGKSKSEKKRLVEETERLWNLSLTTQPL